jgi:hypothetical protein
MMYKTIFTIDGITPAYIGYTSGKLWNGWATPCFEINEALQVMADYNKDTGNPMFYDEATDTFRIPETEYADEEMWKGANVATEEGIKHVYDIGAYCWVWDAVNDGDRRYLAQQVEEFIFYHDTYKHMDEYDSRRDQAVDSITKQFQDLNTFHKAICIMRDEDLEAKARFEKLGGILNVF